MYVLCDHRNITDKKKKATPSHFIIAIRKQDKEHQYSRLIGDNNDHSL